MSTVEDDDCAEYVVQDGVDAFLERVSGMMAGHYLRELDWQCDVAREIGIPEEMIAAERARCVESWSEHRERIIEEARQNLARRVRG